MKLNKIGELELENENYLNIKKRIDEGVSPKVALEEELSKENLKLKDVHSLNAKMSQMRDEKIVEIYSMLVCEFWNNK